MIAGFSHQEVGLLILFVTGILEGLWLGFLLGLRYLPPVPVPPVASGSSRKPGKFKRLNFEEFD